MEPQRAFPFESSLPVATLGSSHLAQLKSFGVFQQGPRLIHSSEKPFSSNPATLLHPEVLPSLAPPNPHGSSSLSAVSQLRNTILVMSMSMWTLARS